MPFEHAYSHVNAFSSAMQAYITLGSEKHLRAARNGFEMVTTQSFSTGGWGPNEAFGEPGTGQLGDSLRRRTRASRRHVAHTVISRSRGTCCASRKRRVTATAWSGCFTTPFSGRGRSRPTAHRSTTPTMGPPGEKVWYRDKWPCCSGTFPQLAADYHISTYLRSADGVYVNLFTPSSVRVDRWRCDNSRLTQQTKYPFDNKIQIQGIGLAVQGLHDLRPHSRLGAA